MARFGLAAVAASAALMACASSAGAATVDNPGPFTATFNGGELSIADGTVKVPLSGTTSITVGGTIDGDGNVTVPASSLTFPSFSQPGIGSVQFSPLTSSGTLNPSTGSADFVVRVQATALVLGFTCTVDALELPLTTGTSGSLTGTPYSAADGSLTVVNGTFDLGAVQCNAPLPGGFTDFFKSGHNTLKASGTVTPVIKPAVGQPANSNPPAGNPPQQLPPTQQGPQVGLPAPCIVPKLKGLTLAKAKTALKKAACKTGKVTKKKSSKKKGTVIASNPAAGKTRATGAKVALTVSDGPAKKKKTKKR